MIETLKFKWTTGISKSHPSVNPRSTSTLRVFLEPNYKNPKKTNSEKSVQLVRVFPLASTSDSDPTDIKS